jgi:hypothetical protein
MFVLDQTLGYMPDKRWMGSTKIEKQYPGNLAIPGFASAELGDLRRRKGL